MRHHEEHRVKRFPLIDFRFGHVQQGMQMSIIRPDAPACPGRAMPCWTYFQAFCREYFYQKAPF
jgi:hypothetical protein